MTLEELVHAVGINVNEKDYPDLYKDLLKLLEQ